MDGGSAAQYNPQTVEEVFRDFKGRRAAMVKALTTEEVPPELPEPALGINFARDGMQEKDWLSLVAVHSDAWLLAVAFYFGARFGFDKLQRSKQWFNLYTVFQLKSLTNAALRHSTYMACFAHLRDLATPLPFPMKRLFGMINDLPSIYEVVSSRNKRVSESQAKFPKAQFKEEDDELDEEEEDEHGDTLCGACGENYASDEFWICCDICETWFHGKCVKITPAKAEHIKQYKCPTCSSKKSRPI
ncbi:hypothetical protein ZIOFF_004555 [Zingiber officinale]|uniref:PHD finger protein ALFIN-LIKE n=1 Tax=Zingiber officinale TaxID=94328 RepID=A0A8J5HMF9_ZINOF|nr:hypothetical protein ZIOFF_004555 [Zingiber officinale]